MKKAFFLSKGLEKFSDNQISDVSLIKGGRLGGVPVYGGPSDDIYYPTSGGGGGNYCPEGQVWSDKLGMCISEAISVHDFVTK